MEEPVLPLRPIPNARLHAIIPIVFFGVAMLLCAYPLFWIVVAKSGHAVAQNLAPRVYPNAEKLAETNGNLGNTGFQIQRHYSTPDNPTQVFRYMRDHISAIKLIDMEGKGHVYHAYIEDRGWWGQQVAEFTCSSLYCTTFDAYFYPGFTLIFYPDPDLPGGTRIEYHFSFPGL